MKEPKENITQKNDATAVEVKEPVQPVERKLSDEEQYEKDWNTRIEIYKQRYGKDPDPDTDLEGLENIITDEDVLKYNQEKDLNNVVERRAARRKL